MRGERRYERRKKKEEVRPDVAEAAWKRPGGTSGGLAPRKRREKTEERREKSVEGREEGGEKREDPQLKAERKKNRKERRKKRDEKITKRKERGYKLRG